jgi:hypothetical protein
MISQENYANYNQYDGNYCIAEEITTEQINLTDNNDHEDERSADHQPTELDHDDADRRTLDESEADEDED